MQGAASVVYSGSVIEGIPLGDSNRLCLGIHPRRSQILQREVHAITILG